MAATHSSGPLQYSGKGATGAWGTDLTTAVDTEVVTYMDDFTGVALDSTNDWTVVKDSGASAGIGADVLNGVLELTSTATTDNDGASVLRSKAMRFSRHMPTRAFGLRLVSSATMQIRQTSAWA